MQRRHSLRHLFWRSMTATAGGVAVALGVYPLGNQLAVALARRVAGRPQPKGVVRAVAGEWAMAALVTAARPVGILGLPVVKPWARGPRPVILLHGYLMGRANFIVLANRLSLAGLGPLYGFEYWSLGKVAGAAHRLSLFIEEVCARSGSRQVDLVGHSMGGMVARYYVTAASGAPRVVNLVTIGSPHRGTAFSRFGVGDPAVELDRESVLIRRLAAMPLPEGLRVTSIWSRADGLVSSRRAAALDGADEIVYDDLGHLALLASPRVAREIATRLGR